jgi:hypothetical protein
MKAVRETVLDGSLARTAVTPGKPRLLIRSDLCSAVSAVRWAAADGLAERKAAITVCHTEQHPVATIDELYGRKASPGDVAIRSAGLAYRLDGVQLEATLAATVRLGAAAISINDNSFPVSDPFTDEWTTVGGEGLGQSRLAWLSLHHRCGGYRHSSEHRRDNDSHHVHSP